ncbi:hypothetical protein SAMN05444581_1487 [Methylocapsa palsarum]|uniref:Uncharacterized protein n=1 Tax=Methylocapsa palsarum TaxID=1612308 RepID=A0A1I4D9J2_9HYPH|nr:hypothetical protein SAMN05444581_1487 [Methylocapsa palsarum]
MESKSAEPWDCVSRYRWLGRSEGLLRVFSNRRRGLSPPIFRLADGLDKHVADMFFVRDIILNELPKPSILAIREHGGRLGDVAVAFLNAVVELIPLDLFFLCHRTLEDDLASFKVNDHIVRMGQRRQAGQP